MRSIQVINAKRNGKLLGLFLFGTEHVPKFIDMGFSFISVGNDLVRGKAIA